MRPALVLSPVPPMMLPTTLDPVAHNALAATPQVIRIAE